MNPSKDIFQYSDYRLFLREYYRDQKEKIPGFTYDILAQRGGFSSASFPKLVIDGKRNLTKESAGNMCKALKLNKKAAQYFEVLVSFNQARTLEEKTSFLEKIDSFRRRNCPEKLLAKEYDYLKKWIHSAIRELVDLPGFREDPEWISKKLRYNVKSEEIKQSLEFLTANGFLKRNAEGRLVKKEKTLGTGEVPDREVYSAVARGHHLNMMHLAEEAVANLPREKRNVTSTTISLSKKTYEAAQQRIHQLHLELLELAKADTDVDQVYGLNMNLFPLTKDEEQ